MPQMSPMIWFIFPFIMVGLVLVGVVTLDGEVYENGKFKCEGVSEIKKLSW